MKKIWLAILLTLGLTLIPANALAVNAIINCASTSIATTYSTSSPSLEAALTSIAIPPNATLAVINNSTTRICTNTTTTSTTVAPTAGNNNEHCVPAGTFAFYDNINFTGRTSNIYVRADGSSCSSGTVDIDLW